MNVRLLLKKFKGRISPKHYSVLIGIASYIPQLFDFIFKGAGGGTASSRYCYSVWLRHLTVAHKNGLSAMPNSIIELGPGNSLGIGLAALISGANKYYAFDVVEHANNKRNVEIFDELVELFKKRERIPDEVEFPEVKPNLDSYNFPSHILTEKHLSEALKQDRIDSIREALLNLGSKDKKDIQISYVVRNGSSTVVKANSIDMIYSQAVMEHIDDLADTYKLLYRWLKPGGFMSHDIDFRCHGTARDWNGHWGHSDFVWKLIRGKKAYLINRQSHSEHINLIKESGFKIVCDIKNRDNSGLEKKFFAPRFKNMSDSDSTTSTAFVQAIKE